MLRSKPIMAYTDGACSNNPGGPGGWAATLNYANNISIISGNELSTTNNRMELKAVVETAKLLSVRGHKHIIINSDSAYVVNAINNGWLSNWVLNDWCTKRGTKVANSDLWLKLYDTINFIDSIQGVLVMNKVKGHAGDTFNEMADRAAKDEVLKAKIKLTEV